MNFVLNVKWVRPYFRLVDLSPLAAPVIKRASVLLTRRVLEGNLPLSETANASDVELGLTQGSCLIIARHLLATGSWKVDITSASSPANALCF